MGFRDYRKKYFIEVLGKLDAQQAWDELHRLTHPHEPVLLCWEVLDKPGQWCHRRMVAEWFEKELGITVPEL